jgi:hypothetical protein
MILWPLSIFGVISISVLTSCSHMKSKDVQDKYQVELARDLPQGISTGEVEKYLSSRGLTFSFETAKDLESSGTLDVLKAGGTGPGDLRFKGWYRAVVHEAVRSFFGPSTLWLLVYVGDDDRVLKTEILGIHAGP